MEYEKLINIIADVIDVNTAQISMASSFVDDLGADSLDVFQIIMGLEQAFDIEVPADVAVQIYTVGDAVAYIKDAV